MRPVLTTVTALAAAAALAACSSATVGKGAFATERPPASHSRSVTPAPFPSSTQVSPSAPPTSIAPNTVANAVDAAMLAAGEIGPGFVPVPDDPPSPLPCTPNRPPVDDQIGHVEKGDVVFVDRSGTVQVSEQVYVYGSVAGAQRHQQIVETGLACRKGTLAGGGGEVTVLGPTDVTAELTARNDKAEAWAVQTAQVSGALVQVRIHAVVVQFAVVAEPGATPTVDAEKIVEAGLAKLIAHAG
jgi:hypothetical protein